MGIKGYFQLVSLGEHTSKGFPMSFMNAIYMTHIIRYCSMLSTVNKISNAFICVRKVAQCQERFNTVPLSQFWLIQLLLLVSLTQLLCAKVMTDGPVIYRMIVIQEKDIPNIYSSFKVSRNVFGPYHLAHHCKTINENLQHLEHTVQFNCKQCFQHLDIKAGMPC